MSLIRALVAATVLSLAAHSAQAAAFTRVYGAEAEPGQWAQWVADVTVDASGHVYVAGEFSSPSIAIGSQTLTRLGKNADGFVAKLDASGNTLWARSFGGAGASAEIQGVAVDASGNVFVAGFFQDADLTTPPLARIGAHDLVVVRLDANGNTVWARNYGGPGARLYPRIALDAAGNVLVGATQHDGNLTVPAVARLGTLSNMVAMKLAPADGSVVWAKAFGGSGLASLTGIAVDFGGNAYLGGYFTGLGTIIDPPVTPLNMGSNGLVIKIDPAGNALWGRAFGGNNGGFHVQGLHVDAQDRIYVAGTISSNNPTAPPLTRIGESDAFVMQLDAAGSVHWARNFGGRMAQGAGEDVSADAAGNVYLVGHFSDGNLAWPYMPWTRERSAFAVKLDAAGNPAAAARFGDKGMTMMPKAAAADGHAYVAGMRSPTPTSYVPLHPPPPATPKGAFIIKHAFETPEVAGLVSHFYQSALRRAGETSGVAYWAGEASRLQFLGAHVNETWYAMAAAFFSSPEYLARGGNASEFVTDLYSTFLSRAPDASGLAYWTSQMQQGMPREVVIAAFMFSPEFASFTRGIFGEGLARAEVDVVMDFYRGLLARLPDTLGFNYWVGRLRAAQCAGDAAAVHAAADSISSLLLGSPEYLARNRSTEQLVGDLYNAFLRRGGELEGVRYWIGQLNSGALTRDAVRRHFVASPEFSARVQRLVQAGCLQ